MSLDIGFDAQAPSLPSGGGAVGGLGETFAPDLSTGTGTFHIPFDLPNGPNDIGPRIGLQYDSGRGSGPFGMGFALPLARITRSTAHGFPQYDTSDTLMLEGAGEVLVLPANKYRLQTDVGLWQIEPEGDGFLLTDRAGLRYHLGTDAASRLTGPRGVFAWHLARIEDSLGNAVVPTWTGDGGQLYLSKLAYGAWEVRFQYESRPDPIRSGRGGFEITTALRCHSVELHLTADASSLVRLWTLGYSQALSNGASLLSSVTLSGFGPDGTQLDTPALKLGYSDFSIRELMRFSSVENGTAPGPLTRPDRRVELVDWFGTGLPDLLEISPGGRARVWPNVGDGIWGRPERIGDLPWFGGPSATLGFLDLNGDGLADLVRTDRPMDGYLPRTLGGGFERPVTWRTAPRVAADTPGLRFADLDGDGRVDVMTSGQDNLLLYYREDPDGWKARPQTVPRSAAPALDLADPHVFLADMTGDGSLDMVRVDGGGVTYWPYLGLGRWADPVRMENPPELPFNVEADRLFLNDIDGDGCSDLLYIHGGRVTYWLNQGGNRFGEERVIDWLPTARMNDVRLADMRGSGTAGILWAQPGPFGHLTDYFYLDFTGASKPYLLNHIDNGTGLVTTVAYSTSAVEAAAAAKSGQPWRTSLPVVVPIVAGVDVTDKTSGPVRSVRYRYGDGRWDGALREFAGFALVEENQLGDAEQPTLRTRISFHVGLDPATGAEPRDTAERLKWRSLRGRMRLRERTSPDGTSQAPLPFDRIEYEWAVEEEATAAGIVDKPRLITTTSTTFERAVMASAVIVNTSVTFDADGNVTESTETSTSPLDPAFTSTLRTKTQYAADPARRFLAKTWRTQQFDVSGAIVADTVLEYDGQPEGTVGPQGLLTRRSALVMPDALVTVVYGAAPPDFSKLGYFRRPDSAGWWITIASYQRTDDATGLRGRITGPMGAVTDMVFDPLKQFPVKLTTPFANVVEIQYDPRIARPTGITDTAGAVQRAFYDQLARVTASIEPGDSAALPTETYRYTVTSLPTEIARSKRAVSGAGGTIDTRHFLDGAGRVLEERARDEAGEVSSASFVYGARGLLARRYSEQRATTGVYTPPDPGRSFVAIKYDALGRVVKTVNVDGSVRTISYRNGIIEEADEEDTRTGPGALHTGTTTLRHVDPTGRVSAIEERLGARSIKSTYEYDVKGSLTRHVDAMGHAVVTTPDLLGRILRTERPEQTSITVFDAAGNPVESRIGGRTVTRTFDLRNRPVEEHFDGSTAAAVRFTYQDPGHAAPPDAGTATQGRLVRVDDGGGSTVFDYDARGNVIKRVWTPAGGAGPFETDLAFRADRQLAQIRYPESGGARETITLTYDARGRLSSVPGVVNTIEYDLGNRQTRVRYANAAEWSATYDARGRPATEKLTGPSGVIYSTAYSLDLVGNVTAVVSPDPTLAASYVYDDLYRLTNATLGTGESFTYEFDDAGNLTHKSDVGDYRYSEGGAPGTCVTTAGAGKYTWTAEGQVASAPWGTHMWDPLGRLLRLTTPSATINFSYDYAGRRVTARSTAPGGVDLVTPDPLYSIEAGILVLQLAGFARQAAGGGRLFMHRDHLGSLIRVTDGAGAVVESRRYDPYGRTIAHTGTVDTPLAFGTGVPEELSGLILLGARYYSPTLGRFISADDVVSDPLVPVNWASYTYCRGNPTSFFDPNGHDAWRIVITVIAAVALVALVIVTWGAATPLVAAVIIGAVSGGIVGGITAARQKGVDGWDVVSGVIVGAAVGGWAAYAGSAAYGAIVKGIGQGILEGAVAGGVNGVINGASMGLAAGFAGKADLGKTLELMAGAAVVGLVFGAALGALTGGVKSGDITEPKGKETPGARLQDLENKYLNRSAQTSESEAAERGVTVPAGEAGPPPKNATLGGVGGTALGQGAKILAPTAEYQAGLAGTLEWVRVLATDLPSGALAIFADDLVKLYKERKIPDFNISL
jgi:RHS repeat-associated protein